MMQPIFSEAPAPAAPIVDLAILAAARADRAPAPSSSSSAPRVPIVPAGIDHAAAAASLVEFAAVAIFPLSPSLEAVYPPETRAAIAAALAPVLKKYDIDLNALPPELVLAMVVLPTVPAAIAAIRADSAARAATPPGRKPDNEEKTAAAPPITGRIDSSQTRPAPAGLAATFPGIDRTH